MYKFFLAYLLSCSTALCAQRPEVLSKANDVYTKVIEKYPSLQDTKISIKATKKGSAMTAAYTWWSVFTNPQNRRYSIKINNAIKGPYQCFQFSKLSDSAQMGVMAHELAHVHYFQGLNFLGFVKFVINQALPGGLKRSEQQTDYNTIVHGMGAELKVWSKETRSCYYNWAQKPISERFGGRYYNPAQIDSIIKNTSKYQSIN